MNKNPSKTEIVLEYKPISDITSKERKSFSRLCFKGKGLMWDKFKEVRKYGKNAYVFIAKLHSKIVGWSLVYNEGFWSLFIYVKKCYRRMGIGTKLIKLIRKKFKKTDFFVFRHDSVSTFFYDKVKM